MVLSRPAVIVRHISPSVVEDVIRSGASSSEAECQPSHAVYVHLRFGDAIDLVNVSMRLGAAGFSSQRWTGAKLWASGLVLAEWLARCPREFFVGKSFLELGCGAAALPTQVAARRGAICYATDGEAAGAEAAARALAGLAETARLEWSDSLGLPSREFDVVLFADGVYTEVAAVHLAECLDRLRATDIYGVTPLHRVGAARLCEEMRARGFSAEEVALSSSISEIIDSRGCFESIGPGARVADVCEAGLAVDCVLVRWTRVQCSHVPRDDGLRLGRRFAVAMAAAERHVEEKLAEAGFLLEE